MNPIVSGPSWEKVVRNLFVVLLVNGFAMAFLLDGFYGYPTNNVRQWLRSLGMNSDVLPKPDPKLTARRAAGIIKQFTAETSLAKLIDELGEPAMRVGDRLFYLGPGGRLTIQTEQSKAAGIRWFDGIHSETDIAIQKRVGYALSVAALFSLIVLARMLSRRTVLSDEGLKLPGKPPIPFEAILELSSGSLPSSQVDLTVQTGGTRQLIHLHRYDYSKLTSLVEELCTRRGFTNPLKRQRDRQEDEASRREVIDGDEDTDAGEQSGSGIDMSQLADDGSRDVAR